MPLADGFECRNLTYHYPDGKMALHHVSLKVAPGECVGLVGPNGAGKSTLLFHLNGILPGRARYEHHHHHGDGRVHSHGGGPRVWVAGEPVDDATIRHVRRRVGLLFQDPDDQLFCPTVLDDVAFGPRNFGIPAAEAREIATRRLADVGLAGFDDRLPHHLSYGERKRACLAAVLACEPTILALDEPSGNLDPASRRKFIGLLRDLPMTKFIASHDLDLVAELCQRVIVIDRGEIRADGRMREILSDEQLMLQHKLEVPLRLQFGVDRQTAT